ncbi:MULTISPECIES: acyltransferase [unclassified Nocardioides]|uniref:acyltransferase n=1 Tax=unclassified Nocardioides TaxID=2615069 RepID=UPI000701E057|nr:MULTISPECIES: acyltransferase [unclassified Nocardioides]KQY54619.1 transferase [Nocardioides sp. Root140]KRF19717.1 transferase [Nocardioides sp. Soil796]
MLRNVLSPALHALHRAVEWVGEITPGTRAASRFAHFGEKSLIAFPHATILGERGIHVGSEVLIGRHCTLALGYGPGDHPLPERGLVIGDRCVIGASSTLTAHESIVLGDDVWFGQSVFVSDASHGYQDPEAPIGHQLGQHQPVSIGSGSWIGHGAVILPGTTIGRNVVVGAGSVVRGDVPDHCVVAGVPARVVRRLEPGVGWVGSRPDDVRPIWSTEEIARLLGGGSDTGS